MLVKVFVFVLLSLFLILSPRTVFAQASCCTANGGAYACDYETSTLYCKDGTVSRECTCKQVSPTPTPSPTATPVPTLPTCVPNSTYDTSINACKCNSGYTVKDNACILFKDFCWATYGGNSNYDSEKNGCTCAQGYGLTTDGKSCISYDEICRNGLGDKSSYNKENNNCVCHAGYSIQDNKCQPIPSPFLSPIVKQVNISKIPSPTPTDVPISQVKTETIPNKTITPEKHQDLIVSSGGNFVAEEKPQENIIKRFFSGIKNFLNKIF
jgi:hypothetical protein